MNSILGGIFVENKRECILKSHVRCKNFNIIGDRVYSSKIISDKEMQEKVESNRELIVTAIPFMEKLCEFVKGSNFFAILTDKDGCILNVIGDEDILSEAFKLKMIPGAYMDEEHIGTNAMSMVLSEKIPIQIHGDDHYITAYHRWTCSAAPIKNSEDEIIGTLDLTGYSENVHSHTLGMVVAAANAIEQMIKVHQYNSVLKLSQKHMESILNSITTGIITSNVDGSVKIINKCAVDMFGYQENVMMRMKMHDFFDGFENAVNTIFSGKLYFNEEVYVNAKKNKLQFNLSAYPIYNSEAKINEIVFVFQEVKKMRKLASKIMSGQAVYTFDKIIGENQNFTRTVEYSKKISDSRSTILIMGESGTGKEVFAQSIHNYSSRSDEPFIAVNCGAIPRNLIESELFGYEEGSFTGAKRGGYSGKFEIADGGSIFLDEIGEMPIDMQTKLLRAIEEGVITRIGGSMPIPVDVRIIAATNKNLKLEVERGNFRKDLYYRLNVLPIYLPPLRERKEDIPLLLDYFMKSISKHLNKKYVNVPEDYLKYLIEYTWPGNIRELENVVELIINTESIPMNLEAKNSNTCQNLMGFDEEDMKLDFVEQQHIIKTLKKYKGNITTVSKVLGIGRNTLYRKIEKYDIDCSKFEHCSDEEQNITL